MMTASEFAAVLALAERWGDGRTVGVDAMERPTHRIITMVNGGHPVDGRQGWDLMEIDRITSEAERDRLIRAAQTKLWKAHLAEASKVVFYKPTGVSAPWSDADEAQADALIEGAVGV